MTGLRQPRAGLVLLAALVTACGQDAAAPAGNEGDDRPGAVAVTVQSEDTVGGVRPELSLTCGEGDPYLLLKLVRQPSSPPPPRGVFGHFKIDDGAPQRVELAWGNGDAWAIHDDAIEADLVRRMIMGRSIYFLGPEGTTIQPYRWDMERLGPTLDTLRRRCG